MITRNVFMKFKDDFQGDIEIKHTRKETMRVFGQLLMVRDFKVEEPADELSKKAWDLSLTVFFENNEGLEQYKSDETHRQYVDQFLRPRLEVIKAWNFNSAT